MAEAAPRQHDGQSGRLGLKARAPYLDRATDPEQGHAQNSSQTKSQTAASRKRSWFIGCFGFIIMSILFLLYTAAAGHGMLWRGQSNPSEMTIMPQASCGPSTANQKCTEQS